MDNYYNPSALLGKGERAYRKSEVRRIEEALGSKSAAKVLGALGHPGYGEAFASKALALWVGDVSRDLHSVVYAS